MTVGQIFTKIGNFIENRHIFMLLNCNCAKLANFENFKTCLGAVFSWTQCRIQTVSVWAYPSDTKGLIPPKLPCIVHQRVRIMLLI